MYPTLMFLVAVASGYGIHRYWVSPSLTPLQRVYFKQYLKSTYRSYLPNSQSRYTTVDLDWLLSGDRPIDAHCSTCWESWALSDDDRARLANFLAVVHPARTAAG